MELCFFACLNYLIALINGQMAKSKEWESIGGGRMLGRENKKKEEEVWEEEIKEQEEEDSRGRPHSKPWNKM